jgi:hypothetical protein
MLAFFPSRFPVWLICLLICETKQFYQQILILHKRCQNQERGGAEKILTLIGG